MTFFWMTWIGNPACGMKTLVEAGQKTAGLVLEYGAMGNHFHWVIETLQANLVAGMRWLPGVLSSRDATSAGRSCGCQPNTHPDCSAGRRAGR